VCSSPKCLKRGFFKKLIFFHSNFQLVKSEKKEPEKNLAYILFVNFRSLKKSLACLIVGTEPGRGRSQQCIKIFTRTAVYKNDAAPQTWLTLRG
jgi:hypothetical protein